MGQVYRAYDATLNRRVAIKLLRPDRGYGTVDGERATAPSVTRILREARMAAALDHPNVVSIFDVGEAEGDPFIVMELVTGRSLRACIGHAEIPMSERVHWLLGVARGLAAAHHAGLIHRDVKPENVLVRDDGVVKVLDFGIARLERMPSQRPPPDAVAGAVASTGQTVESTLAGTPAYMSPEQIRGEAVDARVDQFSWAVVAYEVLTGTLPWTTAPTSGRDGPVSLLGAVLAREAPRLSAEKLGVAQSFVDTVHRALEKRKEARFGSMDELLFASGLAYSKGDLPSPGPRPSLSPSADSSQRIHVPADIASAPTLLATHSAGSLEAAARIAVARKSAGARRAKLLLGAVGLVGLGAGVLRVAMAPRPEASRAAPAVTPPAALVFRPHDARRLTFDQGCEEYPSISPDGKSVAFDSTIGEDIHIVVLDVATGAQRKLTTAAGSSFAPAISPDGKSVAYLYQHAGDVGTWLVPFDGSAPPRLVASGRMRPSWSPDGRGLWAGSIDHPTRLDVASGAAQRTLDAPPGYFVLRTRELEDGRVVGRLLDRATKLGRGLVLYPKDGLTSSPLFTDATEDAIGVAPDGQSLVVPKLLMPTLRVALWRVPLDGSAPAAMADQLVLPTKGIDLARDRTWVAWSTCSTEQDVARLDGAGERVLATQILPKTEWTDDQPAGVPGAPTRMVIVSDRAERRQLWVIDLAGKEGARRLPLGDVEAATPAVSPDGRLVAFTAVGKGIYVVPIDGSAPARQITSGPEDASPSFGRDGSAVFFETASASRKHALARATLDGAAPVTILEGVERPSASPSGDRVAYLASEAEQGTPMVLDLATKKSRRMSKVLGKGSYGALRFSPDGTKIALGVGLNDVVELDATTGDVLRRFTSGDEITALTYVGGDVVVAKEAWRGDVWAARDPWGRPGD